MAGSTYDQHSDHITLRDHLADKLAAMESHADQEISRVEKQIGTEFKRSEAQRVEDNRHTEIEFARIALQRIEDRNAMEVRMKEHQASHDREHAAASMNAEKDEKKLDNRLMAMNEFRQALTDLSAQMATRQYVDTRFDSMIEKLETLGKSILIQQDNLAKSLGDRVTTNYDRINEQEKRLQRAEGASAGTRSTVTWIVTGLSAAAIVVSLFTFFAGR